MTDLLHRFAVPLILAGDHGPLRRALASVGAHATAADPWLSLASALTNFEAGEFSAAQGDLRHARQFWPAHGTVDLDGAARRRRAVRRRGRPAPLPSAIADADELPAEPELEALARLSRGMARLERDDRAGARAEFDAALTLSRRHGFDYLTMQCLVLLGVVAGTSGDVRTMRAVSSEALRHRGRPRLGGLDVVGRRHGDAGLRPNFCAAEAADAERLAAEGLARGPAASPPPLRFVLQAVHGAAVFDLRGPG